jgi:hypothetical protein
LAEEVKAATTTSSSRQEKLSEDSKPKNASSETLVEDAGSTSVIEFKREASSEHPLIKKLEHQFKDAFTKTYAACLQNGAPEIRAYDIGTMDLDDDIAIVSILNTLFVDHPARVLYKKSTKVRIY